MHINHQNKGRKEHNQTNKANELVIVISKIKASNEV